MNVYVVKHEIYGGGHSSLLLLRLMAGWLLLNELYGMGKVIG